MKKPNSTTDPQKMPLKKRAKMNKRKLECIKSKVDRMLRIRFWKNDGILRLRN